MDGGAELTVQTPAGQYTVRGRYVIDATGIRSPLGIKVFGDEVPLRADVKILNGYSAHADRTELESWLARLRSTSPELGPVWLVHGEPEAQDPLAERLRGAGYTVTAPEAGTRVTF